MGSLLDCDVLYDFPQSLQTNGGIIHSRRGGSYMWGTNSWGKNISFYIGSHVLWFL